MWPPHGHRHTVTATRPPPHGHRHTVTATRPPPHRHRHTATATRSPPRGLATLGRVTCQVMCRVMWWVICQVVTAPLTMGTYQGPWPLALSAALGPLAPTATPSFGPWPLLPRGQHPLSILADGGLRLSAALGAVAPSAHGGLQPTAASGPWGTLGHDRLLGRRRH